MSGNESTPTPAEVPEHISLLSRRRVLGIAVAGIAAIGIYSGVEASKGGNGNESSAAQAPTPTVVANESSAVNNCNSVELNNSLNNPSVYNPEAFFPNTTVTNPHEATQYVLNLFSENGPLAGNAGINAVAAMESLVVGPATQGGVIKTKWDYLAEYNTALGQLKNADSEQLKAICNQALNVLIQDVGFNTDWADPGETVSLFGAKRDENGNIVDATLESGKVTGEPLQGIEFKLRNTSKNQNGYLSVLISTNSNGIANGNVYIKGLTPQQMNGTSNVQVNQKPQKTNKKNKPIPNGHENGLSGKVVIRTASGNLQVQQRTSGGGSVKIGKGPEKNSGPNKGSKIGPHRGGKAPVSPGKAPTPSGGVGGPGPGPQGPGLGPQGPGQGPQGPGSPPVIERPPSQPPTQPPIETPPPTQPPTQPPIESPPPSQPPTKTGGPPITSGA